ncbi:MAG: pyridoxamine 5'-phosphate oxidase family protein [Proteobacteria bacterium]|nr:pyridoxamine 5'-phosphate oxidase family protein [Pseudomonadota bacterium]
MPTESTRSLLDAAAEVVSRVRYCWLVTQSRDGAGSARPMGRILPDRAEGSWTVRFVTDRRSHKAAAIEHSPDVELIFQDDAREAFVALGGNARLLTNPVRIRELWKRAYDVYFPTEDDRANAIFVEVEMLLMRLWIRGVTPEPFGLQPVVLRCDSHGDWQEP